MRKLLILPFAATMLAGFVAVAQENPLALSPRVKASYEHVEIAYGQPSKRNRVIFNDLVPYGKVWRTGANQATEITLKRDGVLGGKPLSKGTYTLFTIPEKDAWTIIINSQLKQWGAFTYDAGKDVLRVTVIPQTAMTAKEKFTITMVQNELILLWDLTSVATPLIFN